MLELFEITAQTGVFQPVVRPVFFVLGVGDVGNFANVWIPPPHLAGHLAMKLGDAIGNAGQTQRYQRVIELLALDPRDLPDFLFGYAAEEGKVAQHVEVVFLITRLFGRMGGEDQTALHFFQATVFLVNMEGGGQPVGLVEVPDGRIHPQLIKQARASRPQNDVLCDAAQMVVIVESMRDCTGQRVIFLDIRAEKKHRHRVENIARQKHRLHPYGVTVNRDDKTNPCVLQKGIFFPPELDGQLAILTSRLVVVTVGPENADSTQVLAQVRRRAHVRTRQKAKPARVNLETLVDGKLARKIDRALRVFRGDFVWVSKRFWEKG